VRKAAAPRAAPSSPGKARPCSRVQVVAARRSDGARGAVTNPWRIAVRPVRSPAREVRDGIRGRHVPDHARGRRYGPRLDSIPRPRNARERPSRSARTARGLRLKAILAVAIVNDASGGSDLFEQSLAAIPGVG